MPALPKTVIIRRPFNLDALFGYTLVNVTGEPVTPTKIAIFYLVRRLFNSHFGRRAVPSLKPFTQAEKTRVFTLLYGLMLMKSEVSYDEFRRYVRILNDELGRCFYWHFVGDMGKIGHGAEAIDMLFEDSFYTCQREWHYKCRTRYDGIEDSIPFLRKSSFMYIWLKRVMLQYTRTPQSGLFEISEMMMKWVNEGTCQLVSPSHFGPDKILPFEIDCSTRSISWIFRQLHLVQMCPSQAMPYSQILSWCHLIAKHHIDVANVYLLMAVVHVQLRNPPEAVKCLKEFFDKSMLRVNDNGKMYRTWLLMEPCQVALEYGPVLQGRVHRLFGDYDYANTLFAESIQQAQLNNQVLCNRIANLELTTNAILMSGPVLEKPFEQENRSLQDRRVNQYTIHTGAEFDRPIPAVIQKDDNFDENWEVHSYILSISKLLLAIDDMMDGKYTTYNRTPGYVGVGLHRLRLIHDVRNKARAIEDYANAIMGSGFIQNGMYGQAKRATETMLVNNVEAPCTPKMETESYAVAGVNLVYSLCATGDYPQALETLSLLESEFPDDLNWMSARHLRIASQIVHFERDFLLNRYSSCYQHIIGLQSDAPLEYALRKALLMAATGRIPESIDMLEKLKCGDVRGKIRIHMQIATILTSYQKFEMADYHLEEAGKIAVNVSFRDVRFLAARRVASMMLARLMPDKAFLVLVELRESIEHFGSFIEKAVYYMTVSRCLRLLHKDPRPFLKKCKLQIVDGRWPAMEKLILTELALLHGPNGLFPDSLKASKAKEKFGCIEMDFPGPCSWMLI